MNNHLLQLTSAFKKIVLIPLVGYTNKNIDYGIAKTPLVKNFTSKEFKGLQLEEAEKHLRLGGWIGLLIPESFILVDIDDKNIGKLLLETLLKTGIQAHVLETPNGYQFFFKENGKVITQQVKAITKSGINVDYRLPGKGYIVLPSENTPGREWIKISEAIHEIPSWLESLNSHSKEAFFKIPIEEGYRNDSLFRHTCRLRKHGCNEDEVRDIIVFINQNLTKTPLPNDEINNILSKRDNYAYSDNIQSNNYQNDVYTEGWVARKFAIEHKDKIRYCMPYKAWFIWDGKVWKQDRSYDAEKLVKTTIKNLYLEASRIADENYRRNLVKFAISLDKADKVKSILEMAKSEEGITILPEDFDRDKYLLNVQNGTIDLKTRKLLPFNKENFITKICPVNYSPNATSEIWDNFLITIIPDARVRDYMQRVVGYTLTGDVKEEKLFFCFGETATGKSTFLGSIKYVLGDYADTAEFETFLKRDWNSGSPRNDIAKLNGKRMVISHEVDDGKQLAEGLVKQLTGGDAVSARALYKEAIEFQPQFKLFLSANVRPKVKDDDYAMWRRIEQIPFNQSIPENKQDKDLKEKLKVDGEAILTWAVIGCYLWQGMGLQTPDLVKKTTEEYREEMNPLKDFFNDCCIINDGVRVSLNDLFQKYLDYCKDNAIRFPLGKKQFGAKINSKGFSKEKTRDGHFWIGISISSEESMSDKSENTTKS